jgi:hypothetical protein
MDPVDVPTKWGTGDSAAYGDPLINFYDHAGTMNTQTGRMFSTHFGDDLALFGMQKSGEDTVLGGVMARAAHPVFGPSVQVIGLVAVVAAILYMDHRIKIPVKL